MGASATFELDPEEQEKFEMQVDDEYNPSELMSED